MKRKNRMWGFVTWSHVKQILLGALALCLITTGVLVIWVATLRLPDLQSFQNRVLESSTKIYDRTGQVLLYNLNQNLRQQTVPFSEISPSVKNAVIAIEDDKFYTHSGVRPTAFARAVIVDLISGQFKQGGSTITQQVIKNSLLTSDKKISRKIKEWVLSLKLEQAMGKDDILNLYLNSVPLGSNYYGVEEASLQYFGTSSKHLNNAQGAYVAAMIQAPTYFSPYGNHRTELNDRKNLVLFKMRENGFISEEEYKAAKDYTVIFKSQENQGIKAPHFVMFVREQLVKKYGEDVVTSGGLKVITTLDYTMQQKAEATVKKFALKNTEDFNASNAAMVVMDPTNGQILTMVGSRDYFDKKIEGNFNATISPNRQPGSTFKPFAYVTAFAKGYTPDTVVFDLPTQFSTACDADGDPLNASTPATACYMPENYDHSFRGPMSLRNALAQSINIPAIKVLYLAGLKDTIQTAKDLGVTSLNDPNRYGLTLVLGGGEVSLLEMTNGYATFANNGTFNPYATILSVTDKDGKTLEEFTGVAKQALPEQPVLMLNDILRDNQARLALNGPGSATDFPSREVALKTGTTNDSRDAWIIGYTPRIVVGTWAGNNNNSPMVKKTSGLIVAPMWREFMNEVLPTLPEDTFKRPDPIDPTLKPILRGIWQGNQTYTIDKITGKLATDYTPIELREERAIPNVHSILYWVDKNNPTGPAPLNPAADPQYELWEYGVQRWVANNQGILSGYTQPQQIDDVHAPDAIPRVTITSPAANSTFTTSDRVTVVATSEGKYPAQRAEFYINGNLLGTPNQAPFTYTFVPTNLNLKPGVTFTVRAVVFDTVGNKGETTMTYSIRP